MAVARSWDPAVTVCFCRKQRSAVQVTLQYCLWDHFKEVVDMEPRRAANLAHFLATLIASFGLSFSVCKVRRLVAARARPKQ